MNSFILAVTGDYKIPKETRFSNSIVIAIDGGFDRLIEAGKNPDILIGDMDTISEVSRISPRIEIIKLNRDKDETDLEAGLKLAVERGAKSITILGGTSFPRVEMILNNIQVASRFTDRAAIKLTDDHSETYLLGPHQHLAVTGRHTVSITSLTEISTIDIQGFKYDYSGELKRSSSLGISNLHEAEESGQIACQQGSITVTIR